MPDGILGQIPTEGEITPTAEAITAPELVQGSETPFLQYRREVSTAGAGETVAQEIEDAYDANPAPWFYWRDKAGEIRNGLRGYPWKLSGGESYGGKLVIPVYLPPGLTYRKFSEPEGSSYPHAVDWDRATTEIFDFRSGVVERTFVHRREYFVERSSPGGRKREGSRSVDVTGVKLKSEGGSLFVPEDKLAPFARALYRRAMVLSHLKEIPAVLDNEAQRDKSPTASTLPDAYLIADAYDNYLFSKQIDQRKIGSMMDIGAADNLVMLFEHRRRQNCPLSLEEITSLTEKAINFFLDHGLWQERSFWR